MVKTSITEIKNSKIIQKVNAESKNVVITCKDDLNAIKETIFLTSVPGMTQSIIEGHNTKIEDCIDENNVAHHK